MTALGKSPGCNLATHVWIGARNQALRKALAALLKFNEELCEDVGVSKYYPSADRARKLLAEEEESDPMDGR